MHRQVKDLETAHPFVHKLNSMYNCDPFAMGSDLMQVMLALVKQTLTTLSTFYCEYTSPQSLGLSEDPCEKLRSMIENLKSSGAKLQAEVRLIAQNQGMKNVPSPVPSVPLSFGPGSHHTHSQSSSANKCYVVDGENEHSK